MFHILISELRFPQTKMANSTGLTDEASGGSPQGTSLGTFEIFRAVLFAVVPLINIIINLFIAIVLFKDDNLDFNDVDTFLYKSVISLDIMFSIVYPVFASFFNFDVLESDDIQKMAQVCLTSCFWFSFFLLVTAWMLCAIAINKYIYITFPLNYHIYVTIGRVKLFTIVAFLYSGFSAMIVLPFPTFPFIDIRECSPVAFRQTMPKSFPYLVTLMISMALPLCLIIFFNFALIRKAKVQSKRLRRVVVQPLADNHGMVGRDIDNGVQGGVRSRGVKNVIRLMCVALFTLNTYAVSLISLCFITGELNLDRALYIMNDVSQYIWNSKMVVVMLSDVNMRKAMKKRLKKIASKIKFRE